jgi:hypothetical protein
MFSRLLTYLSTDPLHDPCTRTIQEVSCTTPIRALSQGGVLVTWTEVGMPGRRLATQAGKDYTFAHSRARVFTEHPGEANCEQSLTANFLYQRLPSHDEVLDMQACIRGPGVQMIERQLMAMLASTTVRSA